MKPENESEGMPTRPVEPLTAAGQPQGSWLWYYSAINAYADALRSRLDEALREKAEAEELHRMQLAAISVAALCNTEESAKKQAIGRASPYWTPAYGDVFCAVSREVKERERAESAERERDELKKQQGNSD